MDDTEVETRLKASQALLFAQMAVQQFDRVRSNPELWGPAAKNIVDHARDVLKKTVPP